MSSKTLDAEMEKQIAQRLKLIDESVACEAASVESRKEWLELANAIRALLADWKQRGKSNNLKQRLINGFPFCADHRDKQHGKPCLACENERLRAERNAPKGWQCPGCWRHFGPHVDECKYCEPALKLPGGV